MYQRFASFVGIIFINLALIVPCHGSEKVQFEVKQLSEEEHAQLKATESAIADITQKLAAIQGYLATATNARTKLLASIKRAHDAVDYTGACTNDKLESIQTEIRGKYLLITYKQEDCSLLVWSTDATFDVLDTDTSWQDESTVQSK